jgi:hypothetical protein
LQPGHELEFTGLTQVGPGSQCDHREHDSKTQKGEAVVGNLEKALGDVVGNGCNTVAHTFEVRLKAELS